VAAYVPDAGDTIKIDLDPRTGHEQGGWRPVQLPVDIKTTGVVLADAIKNVDWRARNARYTDTAPVEVMQAVQERLMALLGLVEP